jgi:hypothetical protein
MAKIYVTGSQKQGQYAMIVDPLAAPIRADNRTIKESVNIAWAAGH